MRRAAVASLAGLLILEATLALLAGEGYGWGSVLLDALVSTLQVVTLILVWSAFRLILRVNERLKRLEEKARWRSP